ncbi:hypothetical protein JOM56_002717 [Amanita muscaria]
MFHGVASHPSRSGDQPNETFASVVKSRKGWKSSKNGEAVWPLELEAALVEGRLEIDAYSLNVSQDLAGLEIYVPHNIRVARSLGRSPLRNRFISDYIYKKTGKRRTPKQVGSRIQQMRDTSAGKQLMGLLRPYAAQRRLTDPSCSAVSCSGLTAAGRQDSEDARSDSNSRESRESSQGLEAELINVVYIDLLPPLSPQTVLEMGGMLTDLPAKRSNETGSIMHPRHIHSIDPTVAFLSRSTISAHAVYTVRRQDTIVHTEHIALEYAGRLSGENDDMHHTDKPHLYRSALVPGYWERICNSTTPTQFTIEQEVRLDRSAASERPLFSSLYKFRIIPNPSSSSDDQQTHLKHLPIHDKPADPTTEDRHSSGVWDISAFLGPCLEALGQDITIEDGTFLDEYFSSTMQSPPSAIDSPELQSDGLFSPPPPSKPHSAVLVSSCKSELSDNLSRMPSPAVTTSSTLFDVHHGSPAKKGIETYFDTFHSSKELDIIFGDGMTSGDWLS